MDHVTWSVILPISQARMPTLHEIGVIFSSACSTEAMILLINDVVAFNTRIVVDRQTDTHAHIHTNQVQ